jgi:hypothetical protein
MLVPALASASIAGGPETRVWGFDFENAPVAGLEGSQALESRRAYELWYGGRASDSTVAPSSGLGQHGVNLLEPAQLQARPPEVRFGPARGGGRQAADVAYAYRVTGGAEESIYVRGAEFEASNAGVLIDAKNAANCGAPQSMYDVRIKPGARPSAIRFTNDFRIPQLVARAKRQLTAAQGLGFKGIRWPIADAEVARVVDGLFTQRLPGWV